MKKGGFIDETYRRTLLSIDFFVFRPYNEIINPEYFCKDYKSERIS